MKNLFILLLSFQVYHVIGQSNNTTAHFNILNESIKEQLNFELYSSEYSKRNVYLMYTPLYYQEGVTNNSMLIDKFKSVELHYMSKKEINRASRKGVNFLKIYPLKVENDGAISLLIEMIHLKRKNQTIVGSSTYYYKFSCKDDKYDLLDKKQNAI